MSWCSQWRLRLMWVALDPVQTLLVDSLKVHNINTLADIITVVEVSFEETQLFIEEVDTTILLAVMVLGHNHSFISQFSLYFLQNLPEVCPYQLFQYSYTIHTNSCQALFANRSHSSLHSFNTSLGEHDMARELRPYCITAVVMADGGMSVTFNKTISE